VMEVFEECFDVTDEDRRLAWVQLDNAIPERTECDCLVVQKSEFYFSAIEKHDESGNLLTTCHVPLCALDNLEETYIDVE
jgi:hypothetical protein